MKRSSIALSALLSVSLATAAVAGSIPKGGETLEEVVRRVAETQKKVRTLQADFRQEKTLGLLAEAQVSTGRFVFASPNRVLWTYDSPQPVTMLIADGRLTTWYPSLGKAESVEVKRFEDRIFKYMGASGAIDELAKYFDMKFINTKGQPFFTLELEPKTKAIERRVRRIKIWIDRQSYLTTKFEYVEGDGDVTLYEFTNVRVNAPVDDSHFTLNLPSDVRVEEMKIK